MESSSELILGYFHGRLTSYAVFTTPTISWSIFEVENPGVAVGRGAGVGVGVGVGLGVEVGAGVAVAGTGVAVGGTAAVVGVAVGCGVAVGSGVEVASSPQATASTSMRSMGMNSVNPGFKNPRLHMGSPLL
jgi:hypothetical protein